MANVVDISSIFSHTKLTDISGLKNWNISNIENFKDAFDHTKIKNWDDIKEWNIRNS